MADYSNIVGLSNNQANAAQFAGVQGADLADPFRKQRELPQNLLAEALKNPGATPYLDYIKNQFIDNATNHAAGTGNFYSGAGKIAIGNAATGAVASQFFPYMNLLAQLSGATTGSPAAAASAYTGGINRSQDYQSIGAGAKAAGAPGAVPSATPWWMQEGDRMVDSQNAERAATEAARGGGTYSYGLPGGGLYGGISGEVSGGTPGYTPSAYAGQSFDPSAWYSGEIPLDTSWANYTGGNA